MKKYLSFVMTLIIVMLALTGCSGGIDEATFNSLQEQVDELSVSVNSLQEQVDELSASESRLSAITAYDIWYSQYYGLGTYTFETSEDFNVQLGKLVTTISDVDTITIWNDYLTEDFAYNTLINELPGDTSTWTSDQYNSWRTAGTSRADALGQVGGYLFTAANK